MAEEQGEMEAKSSSVVVLSLPPLSEDDALYTEKKRLSDSRMLDYTFQLSIYFSVDDILRLLNQMVQTARLQFMDEIELYFGDNEDFGPFSPRNEIESLNLILKIIDSVSCTEITGEIGALKELRGKTVEMLESFGRNYSDPMIKSENIKCNDNNNYCKSEDSLLKWGENYGVRSKLKIALFEGAGRGLVALENIEIGETALEIPESLIISEDRLYESDMFNVLKDLEGISTETMLLLWSMRERFNPNSKFKIYFDTLPENFNTGLSFGIDALAVLEGTLLFDELMQAKQHLRQQYDTLIPILCSNYPNIFKEEIYTWDRFVWGCELWYSNSMKICFTDGKIETCLVPIAGLLNQSLCPHILHYGKVDLETKYLKFPLSRSCGKGEQMYLSYGNLSSSHLLTFYGFVPRGENPYDIIPLDFDVPDIEESDSSAQNDESGKIEHMVRGTWFSKTQLPPKLMNHLRNVLNSERDESEREVLETLLSIFNPMIEGLGELDNFDRENTSWDVKLALEYKDIQRRIISSIIDSCISGLKLL